MNWSQSTMYERLMNAAIRFVSYRMRSEKEIRDFISQKLTKSHSTAPEVMMQVLQRLGELGYVNDEKFGKWWVSQRHGRHPKGARLIRAELQQKGIPSELIEIIIGQSASDERFLAHRALQKKIMVWRHLPLPVRKKKLGDFLLRQGFAANIVWGVVDEVFENM